MSTKPTIGSRRTLEVVGPGKALEAFLRDEPVLVRCAPDGDLERVTSTYNWSDSHEDIFEVEVPAVSQEAGLTIGGTAPVQNVYRGLSTQHAREHKAQGARVTDCYGDTRDMTATDDFYHGCAPFTATYKAP